MQVTMNANQPAEQMTITTPTFKSSLSAKDMIPSKMITLAPYTVFCGGQKCMSYSKMYIQNYADIHKYTETIIMTNQN